VFHVPVFFFLSGYLVKAKQFADSTLSQLAKIARTLLLPYFAFYLIDFGIVLLAKQIVGLEGAPDYKGILLGMLDGSQPPNNHIGSGMQFGFLWFLWGLVWCKVAGIVLGKLYRKGGAAHFCGGLAVALIVGWLVNKLKLHLPFSMNGGLLAIPLYGVGMLLRLQNIHVPAVLKDKSVFIPTALLLLAGAVIIPIYNAPEWFSVGEYGRTGYWLFALHMFCGIALLCLLSSRIKGQAPRLVRLWSNAGLAIWALSNGMFVAFSSYWPFFSKPHSLPLTILLALAQLAVLTPFAYLIQRFCPWLIGKRMVKRAAPSPEPMV
jgi:fucose 4-O-acetylase-like acetyltransferase